MPVYSYTAFDSVGKRISGVLTSDTPAAGRSTLRQKGLQLIDFRSAPLSGRTKRGLALRRRHRQEQVAAFARQLSLLLNSGIPLVDALDVLIRQDRGPFRRVLHEVRERVAAGSSLSEALELHPAWFDAVFRTAASVGQLSGQMGTALAEVSEYLREREAVRNRLFTALAYPAVLLVLACIVVLFLMSYVVPQLLTVLEASGRPLPAATRLLKGVSDVVVGHWMAIGMGTLTCAAGTALAHRYKPIRRAGHALCLRLPLLGRLLRKSLVAQFAQMMCLLLNSGVPFLDAVRLVRSGCRHLVLSEELQRMEDAVRRGSDIAPTLADSCVFPPMVVHLVHVGQKSGELPEMLGHLDQSYRSEVRLAVDRFSAALEPVLIVLLSCLVGFIVFATMMPILEATRGIR